MRRDRWFTIHGKPVPLQRSRTRNGHHYLPPRSKAYREVVQAGWTASYKPRLGPREFGASLHFYGARANADLDNLAKAILDGLNGLAFDDDRQMQHLRCERHPLDEGGARCEVELWAL